MKGVLNLADIAERLMRGALDVPAAEAEVAKYAAVCDWRITTTDEELFSAYEALQDLARQVNEMLARIVACETPQAVEDLGVVTRVGASILGEYQVGLVYLQMAVALESFRAYAAAEAAAVRGCEAIERYVTPDLDNAAQANLVRAYNFRATILAARGKGDEASGYIEKALAAARAQQSPILQASVFSSAGRVDMHRRNHQTALEHLRQAIALRTGQDDEECAHLGVGLLGSFYFDLGVAARDAGHYEDALAAFTEAQRYYQNPSFRFERAFVLSEIATTWLNLGEKDPAQKLLAEAAAEAEQLGKHEDALRWRSLASVAEVGQWPEHFTGHTLVLWANAMLEAKDPPMEHLHTLLNLVIDMTKGTGDDGHARMLLGMVHALEGHLWQGIASMRLGLRRLQERAHPLAVVMTRTYLATLLSNAGESDESEREIRLAISDGEALRVAAPTSAGRQAISGVLANTYGVLIHLLQRRWRPEHGGPADVRGEELIEIGQKIRALNLVSRLQFMQLASRSQDPDLAKDLISLRESEVRLEMAALRKPSEFGALLNMHSAARNRIIDTTYSRRMEILGQVQRASFTVAELADELREGEAILDIAAIGSGVMFTRLDQGGKCEYSGVPWDEEARVAFLLQWSRAVNAPYGHWRDANVRGLYDAVPDSDSVQPVIGELLTELDQRLNARIRDLLERPPSLHRVFVIPHRELALIPFWTLATHLPTLNISILPNAAMLKLTTELLPASKKVAIGDVTATLPWAAQELAELRGFEDLTGASLTEIIATLREAQVLHFSGHGAFNELDPYRSGIVISNSTDQITDLDAARGVSGRGLFSLLTTARVLAHVQMDNANLVVLSGCSTGVPRNHPASEFTSLPTAFFVAGARNVIASLWPVDDLATFLLMKEFYSHFYAGKAPSVALALARTALAQLTRAQVVDQVGIADDDVPYGDHPFAAPQYTLAFQHYGLD